MPIRKQIVTDGITSESQAVISGPLDIMDALAFAKEHNREWRLRRTFDGRVADLERLCRKDVDLWLASGQGAEPPVVNYGTREWYARELLAAISEVREALTRENWQLAASTAVTVGALAAEAQAKHHWPVVRLGIKRTRDTQRSGRGRGKQLTKTARANDHKTRQLAQKYRLSDGMDEVTLIEFIASSLGQHPQTIRQRLKR